MHFLNTASGGAFFMARGMHTIPVLLLLDHQIVELLLDCMGGTKMLLR